MNRFLQLAIATRTYACPESACELRGKERKRHLRSILRYRISKWLLKNGV